VAVRTDLHHNTEFLLLKPASSRVLGSSCRHFFWFGQMAS